MAASLGVAVLLRDGSGRQVDLPGGVVARREYDDLVVVKYRRHDGERLPGKGDAPRYPLPMPGRVAVEDADLRLYAETFLRGPQRWGEDNPWEEIVDRDRAGEPLIVRPREAGDRFRPLGLGGTKKLKDFLIDERVPRDERRRVLVVEGPNGIVWVVGHRLDDRAKATAQTRRFARLRAAPIHRKLRSTP
jgi:tRNA(Ile)-lysidine synthase